jgi:hypothetical protein
LIGRDDHEQLANASAATAVADEWSGPGNGLLQVVGGCYGAIALVEREPGLVSTGRTRSAYLRARSVGTFNVFVVFLGHGNIRLGRSVDVDHAQVHLSTWSTMNDQ